MRFWRVCAGQLLKISSANANSKLEVIFTYCKCAIHPGLQTFVYPNIVFSSVTTQILTNPSWSIERQSEFLQKFYVVSTV